jgi:hypothetical protein
MREILDVIDEMGIELKPIGEDVFRGFCPFHNDTGIPNFTVYKKTNSWYCPEVNSMILLDNLTWKKAGDLIVGDNLVGVEEFTSSHSRKFQLNKVLKIKISSAECFEVQTNRGNHVGSKQHLFLCNRIGSSVWNSFEIPDKRYKRPNLLKYFFPPINYLDSVDYRLGYLKGYFDGDGSCRTKVFYKLSGYSHWWDIASIDLEGLKFMRDTFHILGVNFIEIKPFDSGSKKSKPMFVIGSRKYEEIIRIKKLMFIKDTKEFKRGYLAGIYDAEGTFEGLVIYNQDIRLLKRIQTYGKIFGFNFILRLHDVNIRGYTHNVDLLGGFNEMMRFFSICQPKILRKRDFVRFVGKSYTNIKHEAKVERIIDVGIKEIVEIETSSKTFISNGFISHNCYACNMGGNVVTLVKNFYNLSQEKAWEKVYGKELFSNLLERLKNPKEIYNYKKMINQTISNIVYEKLQKASEEERNRIFSVLKEFDSNLRKISDKEEFNSLLKSTLLML